MCLASTYNVGYGPSQRIRVKKIQERGSTSCDPVRLKNVRQEDTKSSERMKKEGQKVGDSDMIERSDVGG